MFAFLSEILQKNHIDCFAALPLSACRVTKPYLLERAGITSGSAVILAVPYFTPACASPERNLSAYAVGYNYHAFFDALFEELLPLLKERYPEHRFAGFADHSPIAEIEAASRAGLGVIGKNGLLLTERYSSYVFLGELLTDAPLPYILVEPRFCESCGLCQKICPMEKIGTCLSALTQKKGALDEAEIVALRRYGSCWGCDLCQQVCPHTVRAIQSGSIYTPIPYFHENNIPRLNLAILDAMEEDEFQKRAYSWRKRETIRRNLLLLQEKDEKGEHHA
ncbi:MAG: epoxyqueuosine reductase [Clostridia bacterium]|nr:epoxyqueuosine reductase [Clostridia bacterium]